MSFVVQMAKQSADTMKVWMNVSLLRSAVRTTGVRLLNLVYQMRELAVFLQLTIMKTTESGLNSMESAVMESTLSITQSRMMVQDVAIWLLEKHHQTVVKRD